ncbi:MAG: TIGR00730 family Rossman fold protein [Clostridia bacterium]|nr:TIGR00730 family Rossman fold protein [Clostridia bacterium]
MFKRSIAVFCGSSLGSDPIYEMAARALGDIMGRQRRTIVFGGSRSGLMGVTADAVLKAGGSAISDSLRVFFQDSDLLKDQPHFVYDTVRERKAGLIAHADAFIALPGGMGTLDEFSEVCAAIQIGEFHKPIGLLNVNGYFDDLLRFVERMRRDGFLAPQWDRLFLHENSPEAMLRALDEADDQ